MLRTLTAISDTIVSEASPSETYLRRPTLTIRNVTDRRLFAFIDVRGFLDRPDPIVNSAVLRLYPTETFASTSFLLRLPSEKYPFSSLRWSNRPAMGPTTTRTLAGTARQPVDFDISAYATSWLNGTPNRGLRIETTSTASAGRSFYSMNATGTNAQYRPVVLLDVSYPPDPPTDISPSAGTVSTLTPLITWRYAGEGAEPMAAYQVQTNANDVWTTPSGDTGQIEATEPQHQLTIPPEGTWFRIRHKSADGRWSAYSRAQRVDYAAPIALTITSTDATTSDPTPTTTWTTSGGTQVAFQVQLILVDFDMVVADSGYTPGSDQQWAPSQPLERGVVALGLNLRRRVRVWDDVDRLATPGSPAYVQAQSGTFKIVPSTTLGPVTGLSIDMPLGPAVDISWRSSAVDSFVIERKIRRETDEPGTGSWKSFAVEAGDVAQGGSNYRWRDVTAPAHHVLTYRVRPVLNRSLGPAGSEVEDVLRTEFIWLADPEDPNWLLALAGQDAGTWTLPEQSTVVEVKGENRVHVIHEGFRGYEGTCTGELVSSIEPMGLTSAQEQRDRILETKLSPTKIWRLALGDMNIPVILRNVTPVPQPDQEIRFGASFDFYQQGELSWEAQ